MIVDPLLIAIALATDFVDRNPRLSSASCLSPVHVVLRLIQENKWSVVLEVKTGRLCYSLRPTPSVSYMAMATGIQALLCSQEIYSRKRQSKLHLHGWVLKWQATFFANEEGTWPSINSDVTPFER
jgi:hypothetical protein